MIEHIDHKTQWEAVGREANYHIQVERDIRFGGPYPVPSPEAYAARLSDLARNALIATGTRAQPHHADILRPLGLVECGGLSLTVFGKLVKAALC